MCGITGWIGFDRDLRSEASTLDAMTETMACRGPDDRGVWVAPHAALGHRRLAVIDLPGGRQPMRVETPDGPVVLVYSGEVYNFTELRTRLAARGHAFTTSSDTEVVLRGYLEWGAAVARRLNGMYAFAIWDARDSKLLLVRDRLGVKPLYYYTTSDGVLFGSEVKALLANPLTERRITIGGLREMLGYMRTPGFGIWQGSHEVKPGSIVTVDASGIREHTYWTLRTQPHTDDQPATVAHVRELLEDIVARQLVADVPRCVLLSGGLDSSALTAIAARQLAEQGETIRSFSVDFTGYDTGFVEGHQMGRPQLTQDAPFAAEVAARSGTLHETLVFGSEQLADPAVRLKTMRARDIPAGHGDTDTSLYLLFKAIREHSTVALSGESADEVFGGYTQFFDPIAQQADEYPWDAHYAKQNEAERSRFTPEFRKALDLKAYTADTYATAVAGIQRLDGESELEYRMRKICNLHVTRSVRHLLDRKDRISMSVGLEVRVPFCDHRLVEYVYNTPWALKTYDGREKSLLRGAVADLLPESVVQRTKSGYPATPDPRYLAMLQKQAAELLGSPRHGVFDLIRSDWLSATVNRPATSLTHADRHGLQQFIELALWLDDYRPAIRLS
jgi:asparagine synthase (glutamine-hydrolysing)